jgi:membrane protease YdiL (CAAX protease family)
MNSAAIEPAAAPPEPPPRPLSLGARRSLRIFIAFTAVQLILGIVIGFAFGFYHAYDHTGVKFAADPIFLLASACVGILFGAVVAARMALRSFPRPAPLDARISIGWVAPTPIALAAGAGLGLALALTYVFVLVARFPPFARSILGTVDLRCVAARRAAAPLGVARDRPGPPIEELLFRGVLFTGFRRSWGPWAAGIAVTFLFAASHLFEAFGYWPALLSITVAGVLALAVRLRSGSIWPAVALHACYNAGLVFLALRAEPG